jgi:hypothetical protein
MQVSLVPPKFKSLSPSALALEKPGGMSFEFANSTGERQYDWSTKVRLRKRSIRAHPTLAHEDGAPIAPSMTMQTFMRWKREQFSAPAFVNVASPTGCAPAARCCLESPDPLSIELRL